MIITPEVYGAIGNGIADDTHALQLAFNALSNWSEKSLYLGKKYYITQSLVLSGGVSGSSIYGNGQSSVALVTDRDIPMIGIRVGAGTPCYCLTIRDMAFQGRNFVPATHTNLTAINVSGTTADYFSHCQLTDLSFQTTNYGILFNNGTTNTGEAKISWNRMGSIDAMSVPFPISWKQGTGTGNVIWGGNFVVGNGGIGISAGDGTQIVGDLTIGGIQFGGAATGIRLIGGINYGERISLTGMQMDAGINPALDITRIHYMRGYGVMLGGGTSIKVGPNCGNIVIDGKTWAA